MLSPNVSFYHMQNVKFPKLSCLFQKYLKQLKTLTELKVDNTILGVITQRFNWKHQLSFDIPIFLPILL